MAINRIHIIGGPGSGKTYLGKKLAAHFGIKVQDLDDIFWDNSANTYGIKAFEQDRDQKLQDILKNPSWIIEGVYYKWLDQSFENADAIIILQSSDLVRNYRIIKRYLERKLGLIKSKKETFKSFLALLKWGQAYSKETIPLIIEKTQKYEAKRQIYKNADEAFKFLTGIK